MAAYFNLNNNEISKQNLFNKFNMILGNQGRLMLNDQKSLCQMNHRDPLGLFKKVFLRKTPVLESLLNTAAGLQTCNFIKKRLQHWCFPMKFATFLRTSILNNICERLLLFVSPQNTIANSRGAFALNETLTKSKVSIFFKHNNFI